MDLKKNIIDVLMSCYDPEIPLDLWSLGLIYDIDIIEGDGDKSKVEITMSLTTPGCSMGQHMADDIKSKVSELDQVESVEVAITFDPPWNPDMMTDDARAKLGFDSVNKTSNSQKIETEWN
tara:strand:+ start:744 stop:1106 length:363 start_codon:yes stop_codon:yes gene_type:complete